MNAIKNWVDDLRNRRQYHRYGERETRRNRILGQLFALLNTAAALFYLGWCLYKANWDLWYMFLPFLAAEIAFFVLFALWAHMLWYKRRHYPLGVQREISFSVDVFIPICGEPIEIVEKTVAAAAALTYDGKTLYLLDDGGDDRVKELADRFGATYLHRPVREHRKAGNLNYGLARSTGELILALDADQVARPELIERIVGYFVLPHIAFVQTAQSFDLPDKDPWSNADEVFYKAMQSGKDYDNAAISCGSGVMYRRAALQDIGGFSEWNLVEDLHTSMLLHDKGWKSVYHDSSYTVGTAPEDVIGNLRQRWQWAVDSLRMFFWDNPLKRRGLSWNQRLEYLHFGYNYLVFGVFLPIFFSMPIWALFSHSFMLRRPLWEYLLVRSPYLIIYTISNKLLTDRVHTIKSFQAQASRFAIYFDATLTALRHRNVLPTYKVTAKTALHHGLLAR
ncbi:MAG TPA: glycosyltransferase, partial [Geobacteraceae bacterium]